VNPRNELASTWMKRGIALLEENTVASLNQAIGCFDKAIELRSALPLDANHRFRYGLAAGWMNRGDALTRLGSSNHFPEALRSYDEALKYLGFLPLDEDPLFRKRMVVAWMNRGVTLLAQGSDFAEANRSFRQSIAVLEHPQAAAIPERSQLLGCAWMNMANTLLRLSQPQLLEAREAARTALKHLAEVENVDAVSAETGLKARHVLCQAIVRISAEPSQDQSSAKESLVEALDAVDDGLKLTRDWELRNVTRFRALTSELFSFGVRAYQLCQPQFLIEFISESTDPQVSPGANVSGKMYVEALGALWRELRESQKKGFGKPNEQFPQWMQKLSELSLVECRLTELVKPAHSQRDS
jgi:tetratricopeptide (TPR) repeat protein